MIFDQSDIDDESHDVTMLSLVWRGGYPRATLARFQSGKSTFRCFCPMRAPYLIPHPVDHSIQERSVWVGGRELAIFHHLRLSLCPLLVSGTHWKVMMPRGPPALRIRSIAIDAMEEEMVRRLFGTLTSLFMSAARR